MDEGSLMLAHLHALNQQLDWAEATLKQAQIEPRIKDAAKNGFARLFTKRRDELKQIKSDISVDGASPHTWKQLGRSGRRCGELFRECLGFLGSAMIRSEIITSQGSKPVIRAKKDEICEIADALLCELNKALPETINWRGVTLLAEGNFFTETTGLIRLPFPDYGIWNLPISAHELGHYVGPRMLDGHGASPYHSLLDEKKTENSLKETTARLSEEELEQELSHVKEFFSDLFAVYALGPAYVCSCMLLRFNPGDDEVACEDSKTHPSYAKRVQFILDVLEQMDKSEQSTKYCKIRATLKESWEKNLKVAGREPCLDKSDIDRLKFLLSTLYPMVNDYLSTIKYQGWLRALELRDEFMADKDPARLLGPDHTLADVLNAAWLWRLLQDKESDYLVQQGHVRATELCREIIRRRASAA